MQSLISQAKQLGKSLYVLSVDPETEKVAHANYVAPSLRAKGVDARKWSSKVVEVLGGKVCFDHYCEIEIHIYYLTGWRKGR